MNEIIFGVCVTAIIAGIYKALLPDGKALPQIKLLLSCFFILSVIRLVSSGFSGGLADRINEILDDSVKYNDYTVEVRRLTAEETAANLKSSLSELLAQEKIYPEKIYIDVNIPDNGSISIIGVRLVFDEASYELYAEKAVAMVKNNVDKKTAVSAEIDSRTLYPGRSADVL